MGKEACFKLLALIMVPNNLGKAYANSISVWFCNKQPHNKNIARSWQQQYTRKKAANETRPGKQCESCDNLFE